MRRTSNLWRALLAALIAAGVLALKATAISIVTVPIAFPAITLDGTPQTATTSSGTWQASGDDNPAPWHVNVSSTDFDNGAGKIIDVSNFEIRLLDENISAVSGPPQPQACFNPDHVRLSQQHRSEDSLGERGPGQRHVRRDPRLSADGPCRGLLRRLHGDRDHYHRQRAMMDASAEGVRQ